MPKVRQASARTNPDHVLSYVRVAAPVKANDRSVADIPCVYAVRIADGTIKFGYTENLVKRFRDLRVRDHAVEVLAFRVGTYADEQALHRSLDTSRHHGREWYHPTPEVLAVVNDMRTALGMDVLAA